MLLRQLGLHGYRRFREATKLRIRTRVFALLGPNEAGKTSALKAIASLGNDGAIAESDLAHDAEFVANQPIIEGLFELDNDDVAEACTVAAIGTPRFLLVRKPREGKRTFECIPKCRRSDAEQRKAASAALSSVLSELEGELTDSAVRVAAILSGGDELSREEVGEVRGLANTLDALEEPGETLADRCVAALREIVRIYSTAHPNDARSDLLKGRVPRVVEFTGADRELSSFYPLADASKSRAFTNLARIGELDLGKLQEVQGQDDKVRTIAERASKKLNAAFKGKWTQESVHVSFSVNQNRIQIHVRDESEEGPFTNLTERSEGLRQFVALMALLFNQPAGRPILLVDEAEQHLHYDAQADLVRTFREQRLASQIIYTTHSAGCLPDDLGVGVAGVAPTETLQSSFNNNFWHAPEPQPGLRPLLIGMGATTLAFLPIRNAVFVEGVSDIVLLPQLLREASGLTDLGFQVAPGLSEASKKQLALLDNQHAQVVYLVDGDGGGDDLRKLLLKAKVSADRIFTLPAATLENCVDRDLYVEAVRKTQPGIVIDPTCLDIHRSWATLVEEHCEACDAPVPSKLEVAYRVLELTEDEHADRREITDSREALRTDLRQLAHDLRGALGLPANDGSGTG